MEYATMDYDSESDSFFWPERALDTSHCVEIKMGDTTIRSSKNLRGIIEHQHRVGVEYVAVHGIKTGAIVFVMFKDNSWCRTKFAGFDVALGFIRKRCRNWGLEHEVKTSESYFSFI
jgi:hypothetical protein